MPFYFWFFFLVWFFSARFSAFPFGGRLRPVGGGQTPKDARPCTGDHPTAPPPCSRTSKAHCQRVEKKPRQNQPPGTQRNSKELARPLLSTGMPEEEMEKKKKKEEVGVEGVKAIT